MLSGDWVLLVHIALFCLDLHPATSLKCMYSNPRQNESIKHGDQNEQGNITITKDGPVVQCSKTDYCFVFWYNKTPNDTSVSQGCWNQPGDKCNDVDCISTERPPRAKNDSMFCCCSTDLCNWNYSNGYVPPPPVEYKEQEPSKRNTLTIALIFTCVLAFVAVILIILRSWYIKRKPSTDSLNRIECPPPLSPPFVIDNLEIHGVIIGQGRYGCVCHGTLNGYSVAVKIFAQENTQYFENERDIYTLPDFQHPSIVKFIGAGERMGDDGRPEKLIVLSYAPLGCLNDFLSSQTIDFLKLCKMVYSLACGLTYLHTEITKENCVKPCIAHRDLSSRNVLIGNDSGCMICDFGFAIKIKGGKYYHNRELKVAETTSLADVGTLRYMAPEVLEGAVNLRDCESSLKQADVYSFALILWEIATRCSDLYQGLEVPPYQLAYEKEVGQHPSMEMMQVLVTNKKARPLFPDIWKDNNPAVRSLKDTIVECWDADAEARLTALCAENRLKDLPSMWDRHKDSINSSGVSPTVNFTTTVHQPSSSSSSSSSVITADVPSKVNSVDVCQDLVTISESEAQLADNSIENTLETSITLSPCESVSAPPPTENLKNSAVDNVFGHRFPVPSLSVPIQPYQGRNPCIERNLMKEPGQDFICKGNTLQKEPENRTRYSDQDVYTAMPHQSDHHNVNTSVQSDTVPHPNRIHPPISYVRNSAPVNNTIPKMQNIPDNRSSKSHSLFGLKSHRVDKRCEPIGKNSLREFFGRTSREISDLDEERTPLSVPRSNSVAMGHNNGVIVYNVSDYKNLIAHNDQLQHNPSNYSVAEGDVNGRISLAELHKDMCVNNSAPVSNTNGIDSNHSLSSQGKGMKHLVTEKLKFLFFNSNGVKQMAKYSEGEAHLNGKMNHLIRAEEAVPKTIEPRRYCNGNSRFTHHTSGFDRLSAS